MIVNINEEYQLSSDKFQWIISKASVSKEGATTWRAKHYFPTPQQAVNFLAHKMIRESDAHDLSEAIAAVDKITEQLTQALYPHYLVEGTQCDPYLNPKPSAASEQPAAA